jgi:hypothetical protein
MQLTIPKWSTTAIFPLFVLLSAAAVPQVVVHCAKSLQRGPQSAALLKQRLQELGIDKQVVVMDGGFNKFSELYQCDGSVVEGGSAPKLAAAAAGAGVQAEQH